MRGRSELKSTAIAYDKYCLTIRSSFVSLYSISGNVAHSAGPGCEAALGQRPDNDNQAARSLTRSCVFSAHDLFTSALELVSKLSNPQASWPRQVRFRCVDAHARAPAHVTPAAAGRHTFDSYWFQQAWPHVCKRAPRAMLRRKGVPYPRLLVHKS